MISFWLLCWKLLRATAGVRRTAELTEGNHDDGNPDTSDTVNDSRQPTDPVTMEISSSPPLTDLERENLVSWHDQGVEELCYPEVHGVQPPMDGEQEDAEGGNGEECDYLVFEIGDKGRREIEIEDEARGKVDAEHEAEVKLEGEDQGEDGGRGDREDGDRWIGETGSEQAWSQDLVHRDDLSDGHLSDDHHSDGHLSDGHHSEGNHSNDHHSDGDLSDGHTSDTSLSNGHHSDGHLSDGHLSDCHQAELAVVNSDSDPGDDQWAAFTPSDVTDQEETSGGVDGEVPDGEGKEEERREGEERREEEEKRRVEEEEEERREKEEKRRVEEEERDEAEGESGREEDMSRGREDGDDEEDTRSKRDVPLRSPSASSTASSTDPDRKVPVDFCVHQESHSVNVSSEHVDFLLARQQWRKMEEEVRGQPLPTPGLRAQGSFQGTHTSLYPPARSPRLKHREIHPSVCREPPLPSTVSPGSEDSGLDDSSYRSPPEEPETAVEREIRLTLEREERHRRERGRINKGLPPRPTTLQTGRSPPRPPACRTPTLSISPSPSCSSSLPRSGVYHEMTASNVIILEPDCSGSSSRSRLLSCARGGLSDWPASLEAGPSANVIVVETSNLIIRSASEFCLSTAPTTSSTETQESTFSSNPFFKLRSISSQSLVEQEIRLVRQREDEWRRQREDMWRRSREEEWKRGRESYHTVLVSPGLNDNLIYNVPEVPDRSVSSPSSPSRTRKMERSSLSCDHKFPSSLSSLPRRQNAMAQRWEDSLLANQKKE